MSTGYPFCDCDCPSVVTSPRHVIRPSVFAFSYVPDNVCHTTLHPDPVCTLEGDSYHDSFHLPLSCFSSCVLLSDQVSQTYAITGSVHSSNAFLLSLIGTFLSCMMFYYLTEVDISVNLLDLLSVDNHIILVDMPVTHFCSLPQMHLKAYWLADAIHILDHSL